MRVNDLLSHLPSLFRQKASCLSRKGQMVSVKQRFIRSIAMIYCEYTYAAPLVPGCCTFLVPFFQFVYSYSYSYFFCYTLIVICQYSNYIYTLLSVSKIYTTIVILFI